MTLDELEALARAATPGPWVVQQPEVGSPFYIDTHTSEDGPEPVVASPMLAALRDAAYIAAWSPERILALVAVARAAGDWENPIGLRDALRALDAVP